MRNTPTILLGIAVMMLAYALIIHTDNCKATRIPYVPTFTYLQDSAKFRGRLQDDFIDQSRLFNTYQDSVIQSVGTRKLYRYVDSCKAINERAQAIYKLMYPPQTNQSNASNR